MADLATALGLEEVADLGFEAEHLLVEIERGFHVVRGEAQVMNTAIDGHCCVP